MEEEEDDEEEEKDNMDEFDEPIDNKINPRISSAYGVPQVGRVGLFPSQCGTFVAEDGREYIIVPTEIYRWIICIPFTGKFKEVMMEKGMKRVPVVNVDTQEDWSYDVEVFLEGKVMAPFARLKIILDRDSEKRVPKIKIFEMDG